MRENTLEYDDWHDDSQPDRVDSSSDKRLAYPSSALPKDIIINNKDNDNNNSGAANSGPLLIAHYSSATNQTYGLAYQISESQRSINESAKRRHSSSFKDYISRALLFKGTPSSLPSSSDRRANNYSYLLMVTLLCLNVLMSVLNTILLSFLVKSLQLGENANLNDGQSLLLSFAGNNNYKLNHLTWDAHSEGAMVLDVPASIVGRDKFLSVDSIESHGRDSSLVIGALSQVVESAAQRQATTSDSDNLNKLESVESNDDDLSQEKGLREPWQKKSDLPRGRPKSTAGKILISTGKLPAASYISINDINQNHKAPAVEFVTDALIINQLSGGGGHLATRSTAAASSSLKLEKDTAAAAAAADDDDDDVDDNALSQRLPSLAEAGPGASKRRLVELDARRQSVDLPLLAKIELYPGAASSLYVNNVFSCDAGISGMLNSNLDVQTRLGNLSCHSGQTLGLISRSGKVNLAPVRSLILDAPTLQMSAPSTRRLFMSGIKFVNVEQAHKRAHKKTSQTSGTLTAAAAAAEGDEQSRRLQEFARRHQQHERLHSYALVLADGTLMAASD